MKIKPDLKISSSDFWYDICIGHINPSEILVDQDIAKRVEEAVDLLEKFEQACNDEIEGFIQ